MQTLQIAGNISPGPLSSACPRRINPSSLRLSPMRLTQSTPASPRGPDAAVCDKLDLPPFFWEVRLHVWTGCTCAIMRLLESEGRCLLQGAHASRCSPSPVLVQLTGLVTVTGSWTLPCCTSSQVLCS